MREDSTRTARGILHRLARRPARLAVASFLAVILLGALVLCTPLCNPRDPQTGRRPWTHPVDALFTATSAVCVTGLIVRDTGSEWSLFGQLVILCLIQAGGLGIMTVYAFLASIIQSRLSMRFERTLADMVESRPEERVLSTLKFICLLTLVLEAAGACLLFLSWRNRFDGPLQCLYFSVFHSISAFCNAGFSLYPDSLVRYRGDVPVNLVFCALIVTGGLGFLVVRELKQYLRWHLFVRTGKRPRLSTHSRLVLAATGLLILIGFVGVYTMESTTSLSEAPLRERLLGALFQSITPRTAGFNTMELGRDGVMVIAPSTALLLMALMFVGGSPGSTAGGVKTTTLGVMIASIAATLRGSHRAEMFHHSVRQETVHRVASIILLGMTALLAGIFVLLITETGASFQQVAFEATSAFGTVGLTLGLTPHLTIWGRLVIPALMFVGRLGPVTIVMSAATVEQRVPYRYPTGHILVG